MTKKKKRIDKKKLKSAYGSVISLQYGVYICGIRLSKEKRYWCPVCQIENGKKILTVKEVVRKISEDECTEKGLPSKTQKIYFVCSECERKFEIHQLRRIVPFLNQMTIVLSIGHIIINVMMFKNSFKLAGNKTYDDAVEAVMMLWENYINPIPNAWSLHDIDAHFMFDVVMRNVNFNIRFTIDKISLNRLMNRDEYRNHVYLSKYESTSDTHVNIKMLAEKPDNLEYNVLVYERGGIEDPYFIQTTEKSISVRSLCLLLFSSFHRLWVFSSDAITTA